MAFKNAIDAFEKAVQEAAEAATGSLHNENLSDVGKENAKTAILNKLQQDADKFTSEIHTAAQAFCDAFKVQLPEDGKDHSADVANATNIIGMVGSSMTTDVLRGILDPLKGSYKNLKMIYDIMEARKGAAGYNEKVMSLLDDYMGINTRVGEYLNALDEIGDVANPDGLKLSFAASSYVGGTTVYIDPKVPYSFYVCGERMADVEKKRKALDASSGLVPGLCTIFGLF